jgi:chromosome segregation ATPase
MKSKPNNQTSQRAVDSAADKLLASGIRPTVQLLHEALGGSPRGLRAMLEDWRGRLVKRAAVLADSPASAMPEERAEEIVRKAIDNARGSLRDRIRSTRRRLSAIGAPAPGSSGHHVEIDRSELARLEDELGDLQSELAAHAQKVSEAKAGIAALEKRVEHIFRSVRLLSVRQRGR